MSFITDIFGGGGGTPDIPPVIQPPTRQDAAPAADMARRLATSRGRASTILTDEMGSINGNGKQKKLGVKS